MEAGFVGRVVEAAMLDGWAGLPIHTPACLHIRGRLRHRTCVPATAGLP